ncbi:MAG: CoA transferase [Dehalococcoidia bacterium]|nr:CoA transferase [Dehalococcoidia bacterium]
MQRHRRAGARREHRPRSGRAAATASASTLPSARGRSLVDHVTAANELQAAGVPAAPVMANWEVISDNHLHDRGFFQVIRHPVAGTHFFPGFPWRFEKTPTAVRRPAPLFAEHNREVFCDILGMSEDQVRRLYDEGVTGDEPIYAAGPQL